METKSNRGKFTAWNEKVNECNALSQTPPGGANRQQISGPGFVVSLSLPNRGPKLFLTWAETGVAELSPYPRDAWHYPTWRCANDNVRRALGHRTSDYAIRIIRTRTAKSGRGAQPPYGSDGDAGIIICSTSEFRIER